VSYECPILTYYKGRIELQSVQRICPLVGLVKVSHDSGIGPSELKWN